MSPGTLWILTVLKIAADITNQDQYICKVHKILF